MCIVIDACVFGSVFNPNSQGHSEFKPVRDWVYDKEKRGQVVYGGSKYKKELGKHIGLFTELAKKRKAIKLDDGQVDLTAAGLRENLPKTFNDEHLLAIFILSGCKLLCSTNDNDFAVIQDKVYYPKGKKPPRIYKALSHAHLLSDENCKPCEKISKRNA
jgi:hypothetical protein